MINSVRRIWQSLPRWQAMGLARLLSLLAGLLAALIFSYVLYRLGLPSKPFIYVAF